MKKEGLKGFSIKKKDWKAVTILYCKSVIHFKENHRKKMAWEDAAKSI